MNRLKGLKLKFDVTDNPELSAAIQKRVFGLGSGWPGMKAHDVQYTNSCVLYTDYWGDGKLTASVGVDSSESDYTLSTLDDLYHLPKTHTVSFDGEDEIEISAESFAAFKKSLIK